MKTVFSGVQPSGKLILGNYLGAIQYFVSLQDEVDRAVYCVVDLHAITVPQDPETLRENIYHVTSIYLGAGIDPSRGILFAQSDVSQHAELAWILDTIATFGEVSRQTQFKEKSEGKESVSVGLFNYPVLMAADILLYDTTQVPVGDDQKQHVELARDLAQRFNSRFGETFVMPEPVIPKAGARIMRLDAPTKKMDKSAQGDDPGVIRLLDDPDVVRAKFKRAVTDSGTEIKAGPDKPALTNLLTIYAQCSGKSVQELEREHEHQNYASFKEGLAEAVVAKLTPIREKALGYSHDELDRILSDGAEKARAIARPKLKDVKEKLGLWR